LDIVAAFAPPSGERQPSGWTNLVMFALIFAVFYFLVLAPMRKQKKKHADMVQNLRAGDRVVTSGGIHGTVVGVSEDLIQLRIADQVKVDVAKSAISGLQRPGE
jgi:preprotein translocase subunit YajC